MKRLKKGIINHKLVKQTKIILINTTLQHIYLVQLIITRDENREKHSPSVSVAMNDYVLLIDTNNGLPCRIIPV